MHAALAWRQQEADCTCLANGVEVGQASQGFSTDVGDHVLVQGHIRGMHQVCHTAATTVLHHYPKRLTPTPAALCTTPSFDTHDSVCVHDVGPGVARDVRGAYNTCAEACEDQTNDCKNHCPMCLQPRSTADIGACLHMFDVISSDAVLWVVES